MHQPSEEISGEVLRITYHDPDSTFTVAKLTSSIEKLKEVSIVGKIPAIQIGHIVHCTGSWIQDPRYGRQFQVSSLRFELPTNPQAIEKLLASGIIRGIGPKTAEKIVAAFQEKTFHILEKEPDRIASVSGISTKKAQNISAAWKLHTAHQETIMLLLSWGLTHTQAMKAIQRWQHETFAVVHDNPYLLAQEIRGIGFVQADKIAKIIGIPAASNKRIASACLFFLGETIESGHTCTPLHAFVQESALRLEIDPKLVEAEIVTLSEQKKIRIITKGEESHVCHAHLHIAEKNIGRHIRRIAGSPNLLQRIEIEKAIAWAEKTLSMQFSESQKEALKSSLSNKISIITGGPGTGKSTITKALIAILSHRTKKIALAAPTGRAAKRIIEITGHYAHTIHRLLHFDPIHGRFQHNAEQPLPYDVIIIDEASMIDTWLMDALLQAIPNHTKLIFVGDVHQLPSIGPGTVLRDCIASQTVPTSHLREIYRQSKRSHIIQNAHRINEGKMPWLKTEPESDFLFIPQEKAETARQTLFDLATRHVPEKYGFDPRKDIQILAPMKKGLIGIDQINSDLQLFFSEGERPDFSTKQPTKACRFYRGDKVIQTKNNYQKEVFNGDIGIVEKIDDDMLFVTMDDKSIAYDPISYQELSLAWAVSVHKYQGSEAPCVIMPVHTQHFTLLTRNLLYTAVTRGKKLVILVGSARAVAIAIKNDSSLERHTFLQETLLLLQPDQSHI